MKTKPVSIFLSNPSTKPGQYFPITIFSNINIFQAIRQRNRTNLLTARQSLDLLLITTIVGRCVKDIVRRKKIKKYCATKKSKIIADSGSTFVNIVYPAIMGKNMEIMWVHVYVHITYTHVTYRNPKTCFLQFSCYVKVLHIYVNLTICRILLQAFFTLAGILVETAETYFGCLQNDIVTNW